MSQYASPVRITPLPGGRPLLFHSVPVRVADMEPHKDWARLAWEIKRRRVFLGYQKQKAFAERLPFSTRLLGELENGRRTTYDDSTLHALEVALHWMPGSICAVLAGGEPDELPPPVPASSPLAEMSNAELVARAMSAISELAARLPEEAPRATRPQHAMDAPDARTPVRTAGDERENGLSRTDERDHLNAQAG